MMFLKKKKGFCNNTPPTGDIYVLENKPAEGNFHPARKKPWLLIQRWASLVFWPYEPIKGVQYVTSADMSGKQ